MPNRRQKKDLREGLFSDLVPEGDSYRERHPLPILAAGNEFNFPTHNPTHTLPG